MNGVGISRMRITLADSDQSRGLRVWQRLAQVPGARLADRCGNLTEAFDSVEHRPPHILLCSPDLVRKPEFDAIRTLCRCLSVRWMALGPADSRLPPDAVGLDPSLPLPALHQALLDCMRGKVKGAVTATAGLFRATDAGSSGRIVLIGSSTGGVDALLNVLGIMPANCPPIVIVQHTGASFGEGLARLLDGRVEPEVRPARHGEPLSAGQVRIAAGSEAHLRIAGTANPCCVLEKGDRVSGHCPSVDVLFSSAVPLARRVTAAILTGMGQDGAKGLRELRGAGAHTIGQDQATSVVYGMPRAAFESGAVADVLPLPAIGPALLRSCNRAAPR